MKLPRLPWLDLYLFGYLAAVVVLYALGSQWAAWAAAAWGPMPVRGGLWSWFWSVDRVGPTEACWLIGLAVLGGGAGAWSGRWPRFSLPSRTQTVLILALSLGAGLLFWYARVMEIRGDGLAYLTQISEHIWFKMSQPLTTALFVAAYIGLAQLGWPVAASIALVNCLAGVVWVWATLQLARALPPWPRWLLLVSGLLAGGMTLFFGYIETTSVVLAVAAVYVYLAQRVFVGHALWPAALALGLTLPLHGQMLYLVPSFGVLVLARWHAGRRVEVISASGLVGLPTGLVILAAIVLFQLQGRDLLGDATGGGDGSMLVPLFQIRTWAEYYTLFSFNYFTELLNLFWRATPLLGLWLIPAGVGWWQRRQELAAWFMATVAVGALIFVLLWNPDLGMAHDWDLFVPSLMLMTLACTCLWPVAWLPRWGGAWGGAALGFSGVALWVVLNYFNPIYAWDSWATQLHAPQPLTVRFAGAIELLGTNIYSVTVAPGAALDVRLIWRIRQPQAVDYTAGLYLVDLMTSATPRVLAQDDHLPLANGRASSQWVVGEIIWDTHTIQLPPDTAPGRYQLWVTLYDFATLKRLNLDGQDQNFLYLADITVQ